MKYLPQLCALTLVIGFFLPIASVDQAETGNGIKFNGVKLVEFGHLLKKMPDGTLDAIGPLFNKVAPNLQSQLLKFSILLMALAVIPLVGLAAVLLDNKIAHIASGSITLVILCTWLTQLGEPIPVSLTFGTGLLLFAGITQLLTSGKSQENPLLLSGFEKTLTSLTNHCIYAFDFGFHKAVKRNLSKLFTSKFGHKVFRERALYLHRANIDFVNGDIIFFADVDALKPEHKIGVRKGKPKFVFG